MQTRATAGLWLCWRRLYNSCAGFLRSCGDVCAFLPTISLVLQALTGHFAANAFRYGWAMDNLPLPT